MLSTGIKTPVGIKIMGPDLQGCQIWPSTRLDHLPTVPGTTSAYPERSFGGYYLDIKTNRRQPPAMA